MESAIGALGATNSTGGASDKLKLSDFIDESFFEDLEDTTPALHQVQKLPLKDYTLSILNHSH